MFCKNCKIKLDKEAKFCKNCGEKIVLSMSKNNLVDEKEIVYDPIGRAIDKFIAKAKPFFLKHLGESLILVGVGIFVYNLFNYFQNLSIKASEPLGFSWNGTKMIYSLVPSSSAEASLYLLIAGLIMIVAGILVLREKDIYQKGQ